MRIAQVAPLIESVPPKGYGGTERVVSYLTESLVDLGHDVTLFAAGDSRTRAKLVPSIPRSVRLDPARPDWLMWQTMMIDRVFARAAEFDVIHFHVDYVHYLLSKHSRTPCVTTLHGRLDLPDLVPLHRHFHEQALVSISHSQRKPLADSRWIATVYHGLPESLYRFQPTPDDYFAFVGRISPEKRVDRAIEIARATGTRLRVAAKVDPIDEAYFESQVRPLLKHPLVDFVGEIDEVDKQAFLGNARALLFPIDWPEPFGLVLIEALACGTPVVAYRCGSVPEVIEHGITGFIVDDQQEAVQAARHVDRISRLACRNAFERRFTARRMAQHYLAVYAALQGSETVISAPPAEPTAAASPT
jgi:glycosyltransferase involved in cell wall biosynthesis